MPGTRIEWPDERWSVCWSPGGTWHRTRPLLVCQSWRCDPFAAPPVINIRIKNKFCQCQRRTAQLPSVFGLRGFCIK